MSLLRWTYLNLDYYGPVLNVWRNNGCFEDFQKELGYRLVLKSAELQKKVAVNSSFELNAVIDNIGFAPIYSVKNSFLVFKSTTDGTLYKKALNFDIRKVIPEIPLAGYTGKLLSTKTHCSNSALCRFSAHARCNLEFPWIGLWSQ